MPLPTLFDKTNFIAKVIVMMVFVCMSVCLSVCLRVYACAYVCGSIDTKLYMEITGYVDKYHEYSYVNGQGHQKHENHCLDHNRMS